jgi:hypothetical protein
VCDPVGTETVVARHQGEALELGLGDQNSVVGPVELADPPFDFARTPR